MRFLSRFAAFLLVVLYGLSFAPVFVLAQTTPVLNGSPRAGTVPLNVTLSGTTGAGCSGGNFTLSYGDGASDHIAIPADRCNGAFSKNHRYTSAGIFTAKLFDDLDNSTPLVTLPITVNAANTTSSVKYPSCNITIQPSVIKPGGSVTIEWRSQNAVSGAITNVGNVEPNGSRTILPGLSQVTTYVGSFTGPGGTANCQASVQVSYGSVSGNDTSGAGIINQNPSIVTPTPVGVGQGIQQSLVTCGTGGFNGNGNDQNASTGCQACNLAQLVSNIINFIIGISIPLAAGLFAYAGVLYFTSGASPGNIEKAKSIFSTAFVGFILICTSWLIVNTLLQVLMRNGQAIPQNSWFTISCAASDRPVNKSVTDLINSVLPGFNSNPQSVVSGLPTPPPGVSCDPSLGGCFDSNGNLSTAYQSPTSFKSCYAEDTYQNGSCIESDGSKYSPFAATNAQSGPAGKCTGGYTYSQDSAGDAWCQGPGGSDDIIDFARPGTSAGGPVLNCASGSSGCGNISSAIDSYIGTKTYNGPDNGNLACAWSVNQVLQSAGIAPIDGNAVASMLSELNNGRGTPESFADAQKGDIIVWKGINDNGQSISHVGFCSNDGCTQTISNSSSNASFTNNALGQTFGGITGQVFKVNK